LTPQSTYSEKKSTLETWPLIALVISDFDVPTMLPKMLDAAKHVKESSKNPFKYGKYVPKSDRCPVLDLMQPVYKILLERFQGEGSNNSVADSAIKGLANAIRSELTESIDKVEPVRDYSLPKEAEIAVKHGYENLLRDFLLSPTESRLELNPSNNGRMSVHRLIESYMSEGKIEHQSEGAGRDRVLVLTKRNAIPKAVREVKAQRKEKHLELWAMMYAQDDEKLDE
jgi:hypothetical protein